MNAEKPLHVQVAEAVTGKPACGCGEALEGFDPKTGLCTRCGYRSAPRYDTDWSATGPLIEKYKMDIQPDYCHVPDWQAYVLPSEADEEVPEETGATPLLAACRLILALKEAGKL